MGGQTDTPSIRDATSYLKSIKTGSYLTNHIVHVLILTPFFGQIGNDKNTTLHLTAMSCGANDDLSIKGYADDSD